MSNLDKPYCTRQSISRIAAAASLAVCVTLANAVAIECDWTAGDSAGGKAFIPAQVSVYEVSNESKGWTVTESSYAFAGFAQEGDPLWEIIVISRYSGKGSMTFKRSKESVDSRASTTGICKIYRKNERKL